MLPSWIQRDQILHLTFFEIISNMTEHRLPFEDLACKLSLSFYPKTSASYPYSRDLLTAFSVFLMAAIGSEIGWKICLALGESRAYLILILLIFVLC
jgi:hypothetical protein